MNELDHKLGLAKALVARRKMSRRDFVQLAVATGLTVPVANTLFTTTARAQPKQGGSARFGMPHGATNDSLDPGSYVDSFAQCAFWGALSNSLTEVSPSGEIVPDLAESFEPADGAQRWIFKLRNGSTFHNGKSVTPEDVIESFRFHMTDDSKSGAKSLLTTIVDIKADGPETVVFTLDAANADFQYITSDFHIPIMPAREGGGVDWESGIRTGPYTLEFFEPGVSTKLVRNPNYFKEGQPYLDEVEFLSIRDVAARTNALISGEVDFIHRADLKTLEMLEAVPEIRILELSGYGHYVLAMNTTMPPFDNPDVRMALKYAVDRKAIADKVFLGHATVGNDNPIPASVQFAINPEPIHQYDPQIAKDYLKKAGLDSLKVDLSVADAAFPGAVDAGVLYQDSAAKAGIEINVVREPNDGYWDNVWLKKPMCASYWGGRPTCDWMFSTAYAGGAAWNETFWNNARFNELLVAARAELDQTKRAAMYAEMQQLVHDDGGVIVLVFNNTVDAHAESLAHGEVAVNWENDGLKIAARWWKED